MKQSFWGLVWRNFLNIQGVLIAVISLALSIFLWIFTPRINIPLWLFLIVVILALVLILTFASTAYELFSSSKRLFPLPRVLLSKKIAAKNQRIDFIFLLEASELFSNDALVSFYYFDNDNFEQLIAIGRVRNIQQDSKVQVEVIYALSGCEDILNKLEQNDTLFLKRTRVKPNIPKAYLDGTL